MEKFIAKCILSNDLPWSWAGNPKCPRCRSSTYKNGSYRNTRIVLLPCSHKICFGCIMVLSKQRNPKCNECSSTINFNKSLDFDHQFDDDFYTSGLSQYKTFKLPKVLEAIGLSDFLETDSTRKMMSASPESKCIECPTSTQYTCVQCNMPYCNACFVKVHAVGVVFRAHELVEIISNTTRTIGRVLDPCKEHSNNKLEHYCKTCKVPICRLCCVNKSHNKHKTTKLTSNNETVDLGETLDMLKYAKETVAEANKNVLILLLQLCMLRYKTFEQM